MIDKDAVKGERKSKVQGGGMGNDKARTRARARARPRARARARAADARALAAGRPARSELLGAREVVRRHASTLLPLSFLPAI